MDVDDFAPRLSFFFVSRTTLLEEVAKFRAARRIWARVMREEFGAQNPKSLMLRFHTQTAGVQLTAQQPEVNLVRVAVQALAAVLGGTQSLHTNAYDEAIALPTDKSARLALRTQQVLAHETDVTATVDPFAGSYAIEAMTDDLEEIVRRDDVVLVAVGVDARAGAARQVEGLERPGAGREGVGVLGVDAALDGVAARLQAVGDAPAARRPRPGSASSPGRCRSPSR